MSKEIENISKLKKTPTRYDNKKWVEGYNKAIEHVLAILNKKS